MDLILHLSPTLKHLREESGEQVETPLVAPVVAAVRRVQEKVPLEMRT